MIVLEAGPGRAEEGSVDTAAERPDREAERRIALVAQTRGHLLNLTDLGLTKVPDSDRKSVV